MASILDLFIKTVPAAAGITDFVNKASTAAPDLKPAGDALLAELGADVSPDHLAAIAGVLQTEIKNIGGGKIDGRDHASSDI